MKTTKKGFTLIELIVVIAIIGVLAAILVPSMLGYVKKSKIQSANSAASTILKACNSALEELDENDKDTSGLTNITQGSATATPAANAATQSEVIDYMKSYFDDVANANFSINIKNGVAICCAAKSGSYYGTSPIVYTNKNYPDGASLSGALSAAQSKYDVQHPASTT